MRLSRILPVLLTTLTSPVSSRRTAADATLLSTVKALTLRANKQTTSRRVAAVPQLSCIGGDGCRFYTVDVMRCKNSGSEYNDQDIQWTCQASLPPEFRLGGTEVVCEGYDSPDDPYVLKGSCAVEYRLLLTDLGEEKYRDSLPQGWFAKSSGARGAARLGEILMVALFWLVFFGIIFLFLYRLIFPTDNLQGRQRPPRRPGFFGNGGGGGGGGDDGWDDPPPPYTPRAPHSKPSSSTASAGDQSWRPGFWSGTAAGAAAGYAAANWNNNRTRTSPNLVAPRAGPSNWFGNGGGGTGAGSASFPSPGTSRHQSTGFGGTRRR